MDPVKLTEILIELRNASLFVRNNPTDENIRNLMCKYDLMFLGEDVNLIYSHELTCATNDYFNVPVTVDELHAVIPMVCSMLNIKYEPLVALTDITSQNPKVATYQLLL